MASVKVSAAAAVLVMWSASPHARLESQSAPLALTCLEKVDGVTWERSDKDRDVLDRWCSSVGPPVIATATPESREIRTLILVTWNVHVGGGRVEELVDWIRQTLLAQRTDAGIVLLLQETFRAGPAVPVSYAAGLKVPGAIRPKRPTPDAAALAHKLGMYGAYVPSMRNGPATDPWEREDRGNAVLSTEPIDDIRAIELPFGRQRRVALAATVTPRGRTSRPLRVVSMHFDTRRDRVTQAGALASRLRALREESLPLVAGGDLNSFWGVRDGAYKAVNAVLPAESCGTGKTNTFVLRLDVLFWFRGRLDFLFSSLTRSDLERCRTRQPLYGSDHRPVVMTLELDAAAFKRPIGSATGWDVRRQGDSCCL